LRKLNIDNEYVVYYYTVLMKTAHDIANLYGCGAITIYRILEKNNIERVKPIDRFKAQKFSNKYIESFVKKIDFKTQLEICELYKKQILTTSAIGNIYGITGPAICKILKKHHVKSRSRK